MFWKITFKATGNSITETRFASQEAALKAVKSLGLVMESLVEVRADGADSKVLRMLNEGLVKNDLEGILLPKVSIDEYVPSDPNTDNVVVAFIIRGVPEAVLPFSNFCKHCNGVITVDYGDSETIPSASLVYAEFDRDKLDVTDVDDLIELTSRLAGIDKGDFSLSFPNTNRPYPYDPNLLRKYFIMRSRQANLVAQQQAVQNRVGQIQDEVVDELSPEGMKESIIEAVGSL